MKIAITGHTKGIGRAIHNYFIVQNEVKGFSRSNNYDISINTDRDRIIEESYDCDIFVNNAYNNYDDSQTLLLADIFESWQSRMDKIIINISSRWTNGKNKYCLSKRDQDLFCEQKIFLYPKIINIKPGLINTERVKHEHGKKHDPETVVEIIDFILTTKNKYSISEITFGF